MTDDDTPLRFAHPRNGTLRINPDALRALRTFEQHAPDALEAGGLLLGHLERDGFDVVIDAVTLPKPSDVRARYNFERLDPGHAAAVRRAFEESRGARNHVGDWHTHAEPIPSPSAEDLAQWTDTLRSIVKPGEACFFVIVGQSAIGVWHGEHGGAPLPLERVS